MNKPELPFVCDTPRVSAGRAGFRWGFGVGFFYGVVAGVLLTLAVIYNFV